MDLDHIKQELLAKLPFYASIINNTNFIEDNSIPMVATDGKNIYFNSDYIKRANNEQTIYAFANNICHIAFEDLKKAEGKDRHFWNVATDAVINNFLKRNGLKPVANAIDIPEAANYDAEEMYKIVVERNNNDTLILNSGDSPKKM